MQTEDPTQPTSWKSLAGFTKWLPIAQILSAVIICIVGWYTTVTINSNNHATRLDALEKRVDASDKATERLLTREVFEAYHRGDTERVDRIERTLMQLLNDQKR
jgi:hypothetical protein